MAAFAGLTGLTATASSADQIILWRFLTGLGASGVVPLALSLIGDLFPYQQRGRPLGRLFGAMAGGMAFGSTFGVLLEPTIGWRGIFLTVSAAGLVGLILLRPYLGSLGERPPVRELTLKSVTSGYEALLSLARARRTYFYVFLNAIFHSGVFTWLGVYFSRRYALDEVVAGIALLGYGAPGFVLGSSIGRAADRWGRKWLVPAGIGERRLPLLSLFPPCHCSLLFLLSPFSHPAMT